jgi:hypothetical protein
MKICREGEPVCKGDPEIQREDFSIPEYAASRGASLDRVLARASDAPLRKGNKLELLKSGAPLRTHEHALASAVSDGLLRISLLGLRFPPILAWSLAIIGALFGGLGVERAARSTLLGNAPLNDAGRLESADNRLSESGGP